MIRYGMNRAPLSVQSVFTEFKKFLSSNGERVEKTFTGCLVQPIVLNGHESFNKNL
jgi:hypothetical protein